MPPRRKRATMRLHFVCHSCFRQQRFTLSPTRRALQCVHCRTIGAPEFSIYRALEVAACAGCGKTDGWRNLTRRGTVLRYPQAARADCPACGQPDLEIVDEGEVDWAPGLRPAPAAGDWIHCRVVDPERAVMLGHRPFPLEGGGSGWVRAQLLKVHPVAARWLEDLHALPDLRSLQLDVEGVPWLRLSLEGLRRVWAAWERSIEPLLETLLPGEIRALQPLLRSDLSAAQQLSWLAELEAWGGGVMDVEALFDSEQGEWVDWNECEIALQVPGDRRVLRGRWQPYPRGGEPWTAVQTRIRNRIVDHIELNFSAHAERQAPLGEWHCRGVEAASCGDWAPALYWLWRAARDNHQPSLIALIGLYSGALGHPVQPELAQHYLMWGLNTDESVRFEEWLRWANANEFSKLVAALEEHEGYTLP